MDRSYVLKCIKDAEQYARKFEKSWKKDVVQTNEEILGPVSLTRSNDARIGKMIENTEKIFNEYIAEMIQKIEELDKICREYCQESDEEDITNRICTVIEKMVSELRMAHELVLPKQNTTIKANAPKSVKDTLNWWKERRSQLPCEKINKIEIIVLSLQEKITSCNSAKCKLQSRANNVEKQMVTVNGILTSKKQENDDGTKRLEELKSKLAAMKAEASECDSEICRLQEEKESLNLDLEKAKSDLSQATYTYSSWVAAAQDTVKQLTYEMTCCKSNESYAIKRAQEAFLFKKKKEQYALELSAKTREVQNKLDDATDKLKKCQSQKDTALAAINLEIGEIESRLDLLDFDINKCIERKNEAESIIFQTDSEYKSQQSANKHAVLEYKRNKILYGGLEGELESINALIAAKDKEIDLLSKKIEEHSQQILEIKEEIDEKKRERQRRLRQERAAQQKEAKTLQLALEKEEEERKQKLEVIRSARLQREKEKRREEQEKKTREERIKNELAQKDRDEKLILERQASQDDRTMLSYALTAELLEQTVHDATVLPVDDSQKKAITNSIARRKFVQKNNTPNCDKYLVYFSDKDGNRISEQRVIDQKDVNSVTDMTFELKSLNGFDSKETYYLAIFNFGNGDLIGALQYKINITFANDFDF